MIAPRWTSALGARAAIIAVGLAIPLGLVLLLRDHRPPPPPAPPPKTRIVQAGVAVELSISPASSTAPPAAGGAPFHEGQTVAIRFTLTDAASGAPYAKAYPAAWIDPHLPGDADGDAACTEKLKKLVGGGLTASSAIDLNVYHVIVLGADASISIVDPRFGFGGSNLLAKIPLRSRGADWALSADQNRLFVSMPGADRVAAIDTETYRVIAEIEARRPVRALLQPDEGYLWVASDADVPASAAELVAISPSDLRVAARLPLGAGAHDLAFSDDSRSVFVTNRDDGTVAIVDVRSLAIVASLKTGRAPTRVAYSRLGRAAYVSDPVDGTVTAIDGERRTIVARVPSEAGIGAIAFEPRGRFGFVLNPEKDTIHIVDAVTNLIVQTGQVEKGPDQVAFSDTLAYLRHRASSTVLMVPLDGIGTPGKAITVVDFTGGQAAPGAASYAADIVGAPGGGAMLVSNAADKAIYYYKEGMAAPMGSFSSYGAAPEAVLVVDRSLRERSAGVYETTARLSRVGLQDIAFVVGSPRIKHCFPLEVAPDPEKVEPAKVAVVSLVPSGSLPAGKTTHLRVRLENAATKEPVAGLGDVSVLAYAAGTWHLRQEATPEGEGVYAVDLALPSAGSYYVVVESRSVGLLSRGQTPLIFDAIEAEGGK